MERTSRRRLLRATGMAGVAAATAGCFGLLGDDGGDGGDGDGDGGGDDGSEPTTTEAPPEPTFRWWLPDPEQLQDDSSYIVDYHDLASFRDQEDVLHPQSYKQVQSASNAVAPTLGTDPGALDTVLMVGTTGVRVVTGSFDAAGVGEHLTGEGFSEHDDHGGYQLYAGGDQFPVVAVDDGTALLCREVATNEPTGVARLLIDTHGGQGTRYHEANADLDRATRDLTDASRVGADGVDPPKESDPEAGEFRGQTALGFGWTLGPDTTDLLMVLVFAEEGLADTGDVRTWTEHGLDTLQEYNDYDVTRSGRTVRIEGLIDTDQFDFLQPGPPGGQPDRIER